MGRVEAFSDGVIAVIITIMVLELKAPEAATPEALRAALPALFLYALSFIIVASMWVHHHGLLKTAKKTTPRFLWSNINLLFWMSLIPFATATVGKFPRDPWPVAAYAAVFFLTSLSFSILQTVLARHNREDTARMQSLLRVRFKALFSVFCYLASMVAAFLYVPVAYGLFFLVAVAYVVPPLMFDREFSEIAPSELEEMKGVEAGVDC